MKFKVREHPKAIFALGFLAICLSIGSIVAFVLATSERSQAANETNVVALPPSPLPEPASLTVATALSEPPALTPPLEPAPLQLRPDLRHMALKTYMQSLVNDLRRDAGVPLVVMGTNIAAQLHAEHSIKNCAAGHWGVDGLKPYMRYTLAGGFQANGENQSGRHFCINPHHGLARVATTRDGLRERIRLSVEGWMNSELHRQVLLDPSHRKLNVGIAWDEYTVSTVQQFESDYIEFETLPSIHEGDLLFSGSVKNGIPSRDIEDLIFMIHYDPPPRPLTRGQLSRTFCYDFGTPVAVLRYPLSGNLTWPLDSFTQLAGFCLDPYTISSATEGPQNPEEARSLYAAARANGKRQRAVEVPLVTASHWQIRGDGFDIKADISKILDEHSPGVYTILIQGHLDGAPAWVAMYSIFHEIDPPDTYDPSRWDK